MKAIIDGVLIEGTPQEIAYYVLRPQHSDSQYKGVNITQGIRNERDRRIAELAFGGSQI